MKRHLKWCAVALMFSLPVALWFPLRVAVRPRLNERLLLAAYYGNAGEVQRLLALGADPNYVDQTKDLCALRDCARRLETPLINATHNDRRRSKAATIRLLLDAGADVRAKNGRGDTPLLNLIMSDEPELVRELLQRGARKDKSLDDLLCKAVYAGRTSSVRVLLEAGANANARDRRGATALQVAYDRSELYGDSFDKIIALLIKRGADVNRLSEGKTARRYGRISSRRKRLNAIIDNLRAINPKT